MRVKSVAFYIEDLIYTWSNGELSGMQSTNQYLSDIILKFAKFVKFFLENLVFQILAKNPFSFFDENFYKQIPLRSKRNRIYKICSQKPELPSFQRLIHLGKLKSRQKVVGIVNFKLARDSFSHHICDMYWETIPSQKNENTVLWHMW